jgi:hypothetical protein
VSHRATAGYWQAYRALPQDVRERADKAFELLKADPRHSSLRLKKVGVLWSARVSRDHRALAIEDDSGLVWIWIGSHADYGKLIG